MVSISETVPVCIGYGPPPPCIFDRLYVTSHGASCSQPCYETLQDTEPGHSCCRVARWGSALRERCWDTANDYVVMYAETLTEILRRMQLSLSLATETVASVSPFAPSHSGIHVCLGCPPPFGIRVA